MRKATFALIISSILFSGCSTTNWKSRKADLTDSVEVHLDGVTVGSTLNVSVLSIGYYEVSNYWGNPYGQRTKYGFGGREQVNIKGISCLTPLKERKTGRKSGWGYAYDVPPFAAVGADCGLILGVGAKVDALEFFDFILGFTTLDILSDDYESAYDGNDLEDVDKKIKGQE